MLWDCGCSKSSDKGVEMLLLSSYLAFRGSFQSTCLYKVKDEPMNEVIRLGITKRQKATAMSKKEEGVTFWWWWRVTQLLFDRNICLPWWMLCWILFLRITWSHPIYTCMHLSPSLCSNLSFPTTDLLARGGRVTPPAAPYQRMTILNDLGDLHGHIVAKESKVRSLVELKEEATKLIKVKEVRV